MKKHPEFELYLCDGDFPFADKNIVKNQIINLANELGISKSIVFIPKLPWNEIPGVIYNSFCTILPSLIESFGLAVLESLAVGKPTITTKAGNLPYLVEDSGLLVDVENSEQIAQSLELLSSDEALYRNLSRKAIKRAKEFDNEIIAKQFIEAVTK